MKTRKHRKLIAKIALGVAVVAVAAPTAQAGPWLSENGAAQTVVPMTYGVGATMQDYLEYKGLPASAQYTYGVGATSQDWLEYKGLTRPVDLPCVPNCAEGLLPTVASPAAEYARPAPADNVKPISTPQTIVRPDDRFEVRGPSAAPQDAPVSEVVSPSGFDWTDAGIGAGFAFGLVLLASGMALVARRHRHTSAAAF